MRIDIILIIDPSLSPCKIYSNLFVLVSKFKRARIIDFALIKNCSGDSSLFVCETLKMASPNSYRFGSVHRSASSSVGAGSAGLGGGGGAGNSGPNGVTQLEFYQAMVDFKSMFPEMAESVIEGVLRANNGVVDATIDQLLQMNSTDSATNPSTLTTANAAAAATMNNHRTVPNLIDTGGGVVPDTGPMGNFHEIDFGANQSKRGKHHEKNVSSVRKVCSRLSETTFSCSSTLQEVLVTLIHPTTLHHLPNVTNRSLC